MTLAWEVEVDDQDDGYLDTYAAWMAGYDAGPTLAARVTAARPSWQQNAACLGLGVDLFFSTRPAHIAAARKICAGCPVATPCRNYGRRQQYGVWGAPPTAKALCGDCKERPVLTAGRCRRCGDTARRRAAGVPTRRRAG